MYRNNYIHKRVFITFLTLVFFTLKINAQKVNVVDHKGTLNIVNNNNVYTSASDPNNPTLIALENDVWFDTLTNKTKIWDGLVWKIMFSSTLSSGASVYTGFFIINAPEGFTNTSFSKAIINMPFSPSQLTFVAYPNIENLSTDADNEEWANTSSLQNTFGTMQGFARKDGTQAVIFIGGSGSSLNNISRFSSNTHCLGIRYTNSNGQDKGKIRASITTLDANGFTLNVSYSLGVGSDKTDIMNESLVVFYTAYK